MNGLVVLTVGSVGGPPDTDKRIGTLTLQGGTVLVQAWPAKDHRTNPATHKTGGEWWPRTPCFGFLKLVVMEQLVLLLLLAKAKNKNIIIAYVNGT